MKGKVDTKVLKQEYLGDVQRKQRMPVSLEHREGWGTQQKIGLERFILARSSVAIFMNLCFILNTGSHWRSLNRGMCLCD